MGRLSLSLSRHKENANNSSGSSRSKHLKSSLRGLLGRSSSDRTSIDLGELAEEDELSSAASKLSTGNRGVPAPAAIAEADEYEVSQIPSPSASRPTTAIGLISSSGINENAQATASTADSGPAQSSLKPNDQPVAAAAPKGSTDSRIRPDAGANIAAGEQLQLQQRQKHLSQQTESSTSFSPLANAFSKYKTGRPSPNRTSHIFHDSEPTMLERYSLSPENNISLRTDDGKLSWRRRGSLLGSKLANPLFGSGSGSSSSSGSSSKASNRRAIIRKESSPAFTIGGAGSSSLQYSSHGFKRSDSSDALNRSAVWKSSSIRNSGARGSMAGSVIDEQAVSQHTDALLVRDRSQRSSSVPHLNPLPNAARSQSSVRVSSGLASKSPRMSGYGTPTSAKFNHKGLTLRPKPSHEFFPKLASGIMLDSVSPTASASSPVSQAMADSMHNGTPMTFLVSTRQRSNTGSKHEIQAAPHVLSRINTTSRDFAAGRRPSATAVMIYNPALSGSSKNLHAGVDMSEFGVSSGANTPDSTRTGLSLTMSPSPTTSETPARSLAGTSVSGAFEPLREESEEELSAAASKRQSRLHSDSAPPEHTTSANIAAESQADGPADDDGGAVHETHHMAVDYDPHTGRKMINQYMIIRELGRGTHGKVKLAFDTVTGEYYAIKIIDKESRDKRLRPNAARVQQRPAPYATDGKHRRNRSSHGYLRIDIDKMEKVKREIAILKKCNHPNVVRLREVIDDAHARRIYLVIEYMDGGEIVWRDPDNLPVMSPDKARSVFRDLLLGVEYLHYVGILHRDLKPQNLLCNKQGKVKISDFGVSFLSRRMSKNNLKQDSAKGLPSKLETVAEQPSSSSTVPSVTVTTAADKVRDSGSRVYNSVGKAASPLRPLGGTAAFQGIMLHRFASQPQMSSSLVLPSGSVLHRKGSAAFRGKGLISDGASSSGASSLSGSLLSRERTADVQSRRGRQPRQQRPFSQSIRHKSTMGMTDEFGNAQAPPPQKAPAMPSPVYKLPPELSSRDSNVYDPFDSSDSDEFFTSSDSESDYGEEFAEGEGQFGGSIDSGSDSEDGIVFGASKPRAQEEDGDARVPETSRLSSPKKVAEEEEGEEEPKGTLGDIKVEYSEEEEERELAKTAGTPAFFAPELCCTAEELTRVLKEDRARRHARDRLTSRDRSVTAPTPGTAVQRSSSTQPSEAGSISKNDDEYVRPASCIVDSSAAKPSSTPAPGISSDSPRSPRMKRQSTIASLLTRPFSSRSSIASRPESASSSHTHSLRADDVPTDAPVSPGDMSGVDDPLPANVITSAIDIWAMGVTLYCLIYGRVPFKATTEFELFNIIPRKQIEFPEFLEVEQAESYDSFGGEPLSFGAAASEDGSPPAPQRKRIALPPVDPHLRDLLTRLLDKDFRTRITIEEIKKHPWVTMGLDHPTSWVKETDPAKNPCVNITTQEVEQALVPKQNRRRHGFRASVKRRISIFSSKPPQHQEGKATKDKSSLDWLKIW